jgi:hypothetical protein
VQVWSQEENVDNASLSHTWMYRRPALMSVSCLIEQVNQVEWLACILYTNTTWKRFDILDFNISEYLTKITFNYGIGEY